MSDQEYIHYHHIMPSLGELIAEFQRHSAPRLHAALTHISDKALEAAHTTQEQEEVRDATMLVLEALGLKESEIDRSRECL